MIELEKLSDIDLQGFAGVEDPDAARKGEFNFGEWDCILITEPTTCQVHGFQDDGQSFCYGVDFDNPLKARMFIAFAVATLAMVDEGTVHVPEDFADLCGMEQLI